ncbi:polyamine aminopropyltransferase [Sulfurimicrobium lacus]|uniref:Polyamine aminopropyltransferase n=1 Tax=Sulfurimicrobium lacus TaxID=2715678 RepID=A0A6F8VFH8_9PROT|nr:spermidine synthase-like protein [Sulfurimicrobium lacus]BCB27857.1 polyamine aminopropyltransferase [Sulfurimicrobium lacus]
MSSASPWFEMPSPYDPDGGRVLMLEPPSACAEALRSQLLDETYPKPYVMDDGERRFLHFNGRLIQSAMRLAEPNDLDLRYTQKMMSFLLFRARPRRVLLIGLGGGSLVKFCHYRLPATHMTVLENNPDVIALREAFLVPPDGPNLKVLEADGAAYLEQTEKGIDVLLVDAFDSAGFAPGLANLEFFEQARAKLAGSGVLVVNLAGDSLSYAGLIGVVMRVFDDRVIVFPVREDDNYVLLAFKDPDFEPDWRRLHALAKELRSKYGLDFPSFLEKIERSAKLDLARREAGRGY